MNVTFLRLLLVLLVAVPASAQDGPLVSAEWLKAHVKDNDQVILHIAGNRREYTQEHIPGSRFLWWGDIVPSNPDLSSELPPIATAQDLLRAVGVNNSSRIIVVFGSSNLTSATRPLWSLQYFGLGDRAYLLDGGIEAWKAAGGTMTTDVPELKKGTVTLSANPTVLADAAYVKAHLNDPSVTIVDARSKVYYDGRSTGQPKAGHITGSVNIPYSDVVDSLSVFKSKADLQKMFDDAGVKKGSTVVTYCHVGQQATATLLAARLLGYAVKMYDGSFQDWSYMDDSYLVTVPEEKKE